VLCKEGREGTEHAAVGVTDRVCVLLCCQGLVVSGFAPTNKVTVESQEDMHEYTPDVSATALSNAPAPVCGSRSMCAGDSFVVMQVGTVGVLQKSGTTKQGTRRRRQVQHAVLVLVTPGDGGTQRCEVLTAKQVQEDQHMVAWLHSGCPTMDPRKVLSCVCRCCVCVQCLSVFLCA